MRNPIEILLNKRRMQQRMQELKRQDRKAIREAEVKRAAAKEAKETEIVDVPVVVSQETGFVYRVTLPNADEFYSMIDKYNYVRLGNGANHVESDDEIMLMMCLIDKCEEYGDYDMMLKVFNIFEYIIRHMKRSNNVISFARQYIIYIREYLAKLELL